MNRCVLEECQKLSHEGKVTFPQVVGRLLEAGVERYTVDLVRSETTYYSADGTSERVAFPSHERQAIAKDFSVDDVKAAIRAAQKDEIRFPEFVRRVLAAGCVGYTAYLHGKRVTYVGRTGDFHTEFFPGSK